MDCLQLRGCADQTHLVFEVYKATDGTYTIDRSNLDGSATKKLYGPISSPLSHASASPDGKYIVFAQAGAIWVMGKKGDAPHELASESSAGLSAPDFFPTSKRVLYSDRYLSMGDPVTQEISVDAKTGAKFHIHTAASDMVTDGQLSPDGAFIIETKLDFSGNPVAPASSNSNHFGAQLFTVPAGYTGMPSWQPLS